MVDQPGADVTRRTVLRGVTLAGVALPLLSACGSDEADGSAGGSAGEQAQPTEESPGAPAQAGGGLASTADVPVGGGTILQEEKIVITQPTEGEFKAFTAVCTHQGCIVSEVQESTIICGCHGSRFSAADGAVLGGPATDPLAEKKVTVTGDRISVG